MRILVTLIALVPGLLLPASGDARLADVLCDSSPRIEQRLVSRHDAEKLGRGMRGPDALLEVWIAPANGDWILVQSYANGTSCIVAMGDNWEDLRSPADPS